MVLSLFIVCLISAGLLSKVYTLTHQRIAQEENKQVQQNITQVMPDTTSAQTKPVDTMLLSCLCRVIPESKNYDEIIKDSLWVVYTNGNQKIGIVFKVAPQGYGGPMPIWVGLGYDSTVKRIFIEPEDLKETPGLGMQVTESSFQEQFANRTFNELKLSQNTKGIQAITGATISSRAVVNGIRDGVARYKKYLISDTLPKTP
jgi:electron transport complex protein RnfG